MLPALILDKTQPPEQRRHRIEVKSIEELLSRYSDADKYAVYVNGQLINVVVKESK